MSQENKLYTIEQYLQMNPHELAQILNDTFIYDVPESVDTVDDMSTIGKMLSNTSNQYAFLNSLLSFSKIQCRELKRLNVKRSYEDAVDRKEAITNITEAVKIRYKTLSRMITIKQEINNELKMTDGR